VEAVAAAAASCDGTSTATVNVTCAELDSEAACTGVSGCSFSAGSDPVPGEFVSTFSVKYSANDGATWTDVTDSSGTIAIFDGNSDGDTQVDTIFDEPILAQYVRIYAESFETSAALRAGLLQCSDRTEGLCSYDIQTYGGSATTLADVFADDESASWTSFPAAEQTALTAAVVGQTQSPAEAQFVRVTTDQSCDGNMRAASIAELELFAQACDCSNEELIGWPTDGNGQCP